MTTKTFIIIGLPGGAATVGVDVSYGAQTAHYDTGGTVVVHELADVGTITVTGITF